MTDQRSDPPIEHWNMLGEIELPAGSNANMSIGSWLTELLAPLSLNEHVLHKVLRSAEEYVGRALAQKVYRGFDHIHLSIFAPHEPTSTANTWGFFRIEKIDGTDHTVEFYMYVEGQ